MPNSRDSPATTPRRVLGDLTPRALNTPSKRADLFDAHRATSPLKQVHAPSPQVFTDKENTPIAPKGRKRSIAEVEDAERVDDVKVRVSEVAADSRALSTAAMSLHTTHSTDNVPVPGSPTERNTPTPEPELEQWPDTQGSQNSFSAFINYGACASQNSQQPPREPSPPAPADNEKKDRAALLRTRLGFGIYKVKTNQVDKSGTDIITRWESSDAASKAKSSNPNTHMQPPASGSYSAASKPIFIKANLDPFRPIANLKLTAGPVLLPTATSSHLIHDYSVPSSPPQAAPAHSTSPAKRSYRHCTPVDQCAGGDDDDREGTAQDGLRRMQRFQEGELTSSAVKGNAAKGLMQLMAGRR